MITIYCTMDADDWVGDYAQVEVIGTIQDVVTAFNKVVTLLPDAFYWRMGSTPDVGHGNTMLYIDGDVDAIRGFVAELRKK